MLIGTAMHDDVNGYKNGWNFNACLDERYCMSIGTFTKLFRYVSKGMHKQQIYLEQKLDRFSFSTQNRTLLFIANVSDWTFIRE